MIKKNKRIFVYIGILSIVSLSGCAQPSGGQTGQIDEGNYRELTEEEKRVILHKGTERPFTGKYNDFYEPGTYVCKQCGTALYRSQDKFNSHCGWPSFDDEIAGAVKRIPDPDGRRTEIICANCDGHLGHVFLGEGFTTKNTRHCVNSISLEFIPDSKDNQQLTDTAIFAGGCFWGVEYFMEQADGVLRAESGYIGGHKKNPSYRQVTSHTTGHAEAVRVIFDPAVTDYETLAKLFFEIHDPTQVNRQGPDIGEQYRSEIFYLDARQKATASYLISLLEKNGYKVATKLTPADIFWPAEEYHQDYYERKNGTPYCHGYVKRF